MTDYRRKESGIVKDKEYVRIVLMISYYFFNSSIVKKVNSPCQNFNYSHN